jgi:dimethylargininase
MASFFEYALVCNTIPKSINNGLSIESHEPVDYELTRQQHDFYLDKLRQCGLKLVFVDCNEAYPDCVFVEDTCVAIRNRLFITNPGAETRRGECDAIRTKLAAIKGKLGLEVGEISNTSEAFLDGGDVLFTGRELIVGLSSRTNQLGIYNKQTRGISSKKKILRF